jgi:hypothetical protein
LLNVSGERLTDEPIFLLAICHRSGTSFVYHLMELHPDCGVTPITEDFLVSESNDLVRFARRVAKRWKSFWKEERNAEDVICEFLGRGLLALLQSRIPGKRKKRLFTKSPTVRHLGHFYKFFPRKRLLILVRDGRAVTESLAKGMRLSFEESMRRWADGAGQILDFIEKHKKSSGRYLVVRYEDLVLDMKKELTRIFRFLGLNPKHYDFKAAAKLPVYGSSFFQGSHPGPLHWNPVPKTSDFQSLNRWRHWDRAKHARFNWVAGRYLDAFGYQKVGNGSRRFGSILKNRLLDLLSLGMRVKRRTGQVFAALVHKGER